MKPVKFPDTILDLKEVKGNLWVFTKNKTYIYNPRTRRYRPTTKKLGCEQSLVAPHSSINLGKTT